MRNKIFPAGFAVLTAVTLFTSEASASEHLLGFDAHWAFITGLGAGFIVWKYNARR